MMYRFSTLLFALAFFLVGCGDSLVDGTSVASDSVNKNDRAAGQQTMTVVETAIAVNADEESPYFGRFTTLINALVAADLVGAVDAYDQVTVFAPTNEAFATLGIYPDTVGDLPVDFLTDVLLYHLKEGRQFSGAVLNKRQIKMENGGLTFPDASVPAIVDANGGAAPIILADVAATNGVIHVIGEVLVP